MALRRALTLLSFLSFCSIFTIWRYWQQLSVPTFTNRIQSMKDRHLIDEHPFRKRLQIMPSKDATIDRTVYYHESIEYNVSYISVSPNSLVNKIMSVENNRTLYILVWNSKNPSWQKTVCLTESTRQLNKCCEFTINRITYPKSNAVLFYGDLMHLDHFPPRLGSHRAASEANGNDVIVKQNESDVIVKQNESDVIVKQNKSDVIVKQNGSDVIDNKQKWIYMSVETPINTIHTGIKQIRLQRQRFVYNLTSTYSLKSDIPTPYHHGTCTDVIQGPNTLLETDELHRLVSRKTHQVAWFVSHCVTSSRREQYVRHLQRYIPIDIYGACGDHKCLRQNPLSSPLHSPNASDYYATCDDMVAKKYKFYLAFENSLCADYVTEKFFRFLHRDVIVVALGAADYGRFVASGTYIDVRDYRSPRHLANHLITLSERNVLYSEYLWKKRRLRCKASDTYDERDRRMCAYLYDNEDKVQMSDLAVATDAQRVCTSAGAFYRNVDDLIIH